MLKIFTVIIICCILVTIYAEELDNLNIPKVTFVSDNTCYVNMRVSPVESHVYEGEMR
jgi:hypothetical protein